MRSMNCLFAAELAPNKTFYHSLVKVLLFVLKNQDDDQAGRDGGSYWVSADELVTLQNKAVVQVIWSRSDYLIIIGTIRTEGFAVWVASRQQLRTIDDARHRDSDCGFGSSGKWFSLGRKSSLRLTTCLFLLLSCFYSSFTLLNYNSLVFMSLVPQNTHLE